MTVPLVQRLNLIRCLPGRETVLEERLRDAAALARGEPACLFYNWHRAQPALPANGAPATYVCLACFVDAAGFEAHVTGAAFGRFFADEQADPCLAGPPLQFQLDALVLEAPLT